MDPIANKLFHHDIFTLHLCTFKTPTKSAVMSGKGNSYHALEMCEGVINQDEPFIIKSPMREKLFFAGILILTGNKTYGRKNSLQSMKKHDKLLYKCIPNDPFIIYMLFSSITIGKINIPMVFFYKPVVRSMNYRISTNINFIVKIYISLLIVSIKIPPKR